MPEIIDRPALNLAEDWMILVFLFTLIGLAYTRRVHPARISRLWNSAWNIRTMRQTIREEPNTPRSNLIFNLSFYTQAALACYCAMKHFGHSWYTQYGSKLFLLLVAGIFLVYLIKRISIRLITLLADGDYGLSEYEYAVFMMNRLMGILIFPICALIAYAPAYQLVFTLTFILIIVSLVLIYRVLRSLMTSLELGVTPFYILFYICTLEILPTAIGLRLVLAS